MTQRRWLLLIARTGVSLLLLLLVLSRVDLGRTLGLLARSDPRLDLLGLLLGVLGVIISSVLWQLLLQSDGVELRLTVLSRLYFLGYAFNAFLPTTVGGDAIKAAYVARLSGRTASAIGATLLARVVGFAVLLITALPVALVASLTVPAFGWAPTAGLLVVAGLFAVGLFLGTRHKLIDRPPMTRSAIGRWALELSRTLARYGQRRALIGRGLLLSLLFYASLNLSYYFYGHALGLRAPFWFYWVAVPIMSVITLIPVSLNGYGLREGTAITLFKIAGDSAASALSLALLIELQLLLFAVVGIAVRPQIRAVRE